jgi:hypothetical protein
MHPEAGRSRPPLATTVTGPPWRLATPDAAVEFTRSGDRFAHRVIHRMTLPAGAAPPADAAGAASGRASIESAMIESGAIGWESISWESISWESVEGPLLPGDDPRWPASPALQNVTSVHTAAGPALVGVGLSGRSHFSATILPDPTVPRAFRFEIACRLHEADGWLGSTYRSGGRIWRIAATPPPGPLPRTVTWAYSLGPDGPFAAVDATIHAAAVQPADRDHAG